MIGVWLTEFGGPDVLVAGPAPDPVAGPGQAVIEVAFANVSFVETQLRAGRPGPFKVDPPVILGNGVSGVVAAIGEGTDESWFGRRVTSTTGGVGGYAERVAVDAGLLIGVPDALPLDAAVAALAAGRTATMLLDAITLGPGERVLVEAAGGSVGTMLVQLASTAGARVIAVAGGPHKLELARALGAEFAVDYQDSDWVDQVRAMTGGVDVVLDGVGGTIARAAFELVPRGGRMLSFGLASGAWTDVTDDVAADRGVTLVRAARPSPEAMLRLSQRALAETAEGRLRPVIGQRRPMAQASDAHASIEARATVGTTLLTME